ncbi:MFS transporter [Vibrio europaeus]|uniref:MFS transporter n=1 Tax=Vibrio europaeus TaxID=300876 RepID=A0AAE7AXR2_9VIBR|nr:MFS transporter [Vibrio europaeus]MDC5805745.1 MFS transporter [Vibrio europaeus]MDC5812042.1 MFS transporter [Vibrio europaeus]MDC5826181.1 MFS transporter [Vibrio europaeus]MDC5831546.1 MFS transporter [Vibrio europaeus]MDC5834501.1 MFS transporter [Vibrio europaeus]
MTLTATLRPLTLLFISSFLLMSSHGLSGILLPVKLADEQVGVQSIGFVLSMYSVGFLLGAIIGKRVLRQIGLVRTFAMCGSLGASAILIMGLSSEIWLWAIMRAVMGFCIACATATLDTWFNSVSTESNRGKILAVNQVVILSAITLGQFGLALAPPSETTLFILCGILFSISVSPVVFVSHFEPQIEQTESIPLREIYTLSPLGFMTCFVCGILYSTIANMLPVYADGQGITGFQLSVFMGAATAGGILLQLPMGYLSDKFERRKVILSGCFVLAIVSFALPVSMQYQWQVAPLILVALTMGLIACLYPLSISETFDRALKAQLVPVLSGLLCIYAIGSVIGPYSAALIMERFNGSALFGFLIFVDLGLIFFTIYRMSVRQALPVEEQESFVMHTPASIHEELDPRTEYQDYSLYVDEVWEQVESLAKDHPSKAIALIRGLSNKNPEWAASLAEKAAQLDNIDTVVLFRSLTLTNPDFSIEIAKKLAESEHEQVDEIVEWLIEKEPENTMQILVTISDAMEEQPSNLVETLAVQSPEKLAEFSQELVANMVETNQNLRLADREESDINESVEEFISTIAESAPEQVEEITQLVEQSIQEHEEQINPDTP